MSLLINKEGKQLGPYSLGEARALVLSGEIDATDWAWPDKATDWVRLKDVPGFSEAAEAKPSPPFAATSNSNSNSPLPAEEELWRGHPSQMLNFNIYFFWAAILLITLAGCLYLADTQEWAFVIFGIVALVGSAQMIWAYFHLHAVEYVVTTQRVRIVSGIFSKDIQEIELFRVKDTMAHQSFLLRLLGLGTITVVSGDERHPRLVLSGVPRAVELRERLRSEVMALRQRFGVREVDMM
jgi:membrane protein YdbS with pleckstrin-like domain